MEIAYKNKTLTTFRDIKDGEVFLQDVLWLKIYQPDGCRYNVIDLETGKPSTFNYHSEVERVKATLTVER